MTPIWVADPGQQPKSLFLRTFFLRLVAEILIRFSFVEGFRFLLLKLQSNKLSSNLVMVFEITADKTLHFSVLTIWDLFMTRKARNAQKVFWIVRNVISQSLYNFNNSGIKANKGFLFIIGPAIPELLKYSVLTRVKSKNQLLDLLLNFCKY